MNKLIYPLLAFILIFSLSGCFVQSLHPFYTDDLKVEIPQVLGKWKLIKSLDEDISEANINLWTFNEEKIECYDAKNNYSEIKVAYFKINDNYYVDCMADDPDEDRINEYWLSLVSPVHSVCKVELKNDTLKLIPIDYNALETLLKGKKLDLEFLAKTDEDAILLFTAKPKQWVEFLKEYRDDKKVFNEENEIVLLRAS